MLHRLWLVFAQAVTVLLAAVFVVASFQPHWLPGPLGRTADSASGQGRTPAGAASGTGSEARRDAAILSYSEGARRATASVVNIFTTKQVRVPRDHPLLNDPLFRRFFGEQFAQRQQTSSLGSGVIISADGLVVTNHHVVESADEIEVLLSDGRRAKATAVGSDPETDLAVLRIALDKLPAIEFGRADAARVGDVVLAVGNPFGVGQTVTMGIISALGRSQLGINTFENFIQTDAAINPGNSGGALVDVNGHLMGINTAIYSRSGGNMGIGFAIPVSTAQQVMHELIARGRVTRGWIGVEPQDINPELAASFNLPSSNGKNLQGVVITGVLQNGPAAKAGIRPGDVITQVGQQKIGNVSELLSQVAGLPPGKPVPILVWRSQGLAELTVTPGQRPAASPRR